MKMISIDPAVLGETSQISIIGKGEFSEALLYCLMELGVRDIKVFSGENVLASTKLSDISESAHTIFIAADKLDAGICEKLEAIGVHSLYRADRVLEAVDLVRISAKKDIPALAVKGYRRRFLYFHEQSKCDPELVELVSLDFMVTEKCTLRCKNCSNLMQYYSHPVNLDIKDTMEALYRLLSITDNIWEVRLIGGEPFANPDCVSLISELTALEKVHAVIINSNATVDPARIKTEFLTGKKLVMRFSDYGPLSRNLGKWKSWCIENDVPYEILKEEKWQDLGDFDKKYRSVSEMEHVFNRCWCKELPTLLKGRLYGCPVSANASNLGIMSEQEAIEDSLDLSSDECCCSRDELRKFLLQRTYMLACDYCGGRNIHDAWCEPYIQINKPLPLPVKRGEND